MRGPHYEKPDEKEKKNAYEKEHVDAYESMKRHSRRQHWENHHKPNFLYHFIGQVVARIFLLFILSFPIAWVGMKATPYNLQLMNYYCARYFGYFAALVNPAPVAKNEPAPTAAKNNTTP